MIRTGALTFFATVIFGASAAAAVIYTGAYDVAATNRHWSATTWLLETARVRSIKAHAAGIAVPAGYDEQAKVLSAVGHFSEHCAVCHGAPGVDRNDLVEGMYPQPPDLTNVSKRYTPAELFWIIKNGIKMSGMPSMADDGDDVLWATVGFLERLPGMSPDDYNDLWMASQAQGSHRGMNMGMPMPDTHGTGQADAPGDQNLAPATHQDSGGKHDQ
jgi:mono/diheme cytochrome c family protein